MANPFDRFDAPATAATGGNPFDRFDAPATAATGSNPFDRFDPAKSDASPADSASSDVARPPSPGGP